MHNQLVPEPQAYSHVQGKGVLPSGSEASDRNRGPEERPPSYDMGALLAQEPKVSFQTSIDWFAATVKGSTPKEVQQKLGGPWESQKRGFNGYPASAVSRVGDAVALLGHGAPDRPGEVYLELRGEACKTRSFEDFRELTRWVQDDKGGHLTRVDIAHDDFSGVSSARGALEAYQAGQCVTRSRCWQWFTGGNRGPEQSESGTLYIGSRQSDTFTRIYNKAAQQRDKGKVVEGPWTRFEVEYKRDRANTLGFMFKNLTQEQFHAVAVQYLRAAVDFRDTSIDAPDWERSRAEALPWWKALTEGLSACRLVVQKASQSIDRIAEWFEKSVAAMVGVLIAHPQRGEEWVRETVIRSVQQKWTDRHRALVRERFPAMSPA